MAKIRVTRTLVYEGDEDWIRQVMERCWVSPDHPGVLPRGTVTETERKEEIINPVEDSTVA